MNALEMLIPTKNAHSVSTPLGVEVFEKMRLISSGQIFVVFGVGLLETGCLEKRNSDPASCCGDFDSGVAYRGVPHEGCRFLVHDGREFLKGFLGCGQRRLTSGNVAL